MQTLARRAKRQQITRFGLKMSALPTGGKLMALSAQTTDSMLADLAHGLQDDPARIFDYVHNHIEYVPYFGALKGAALTMMDGAGNDFDQAALMIALLRHAGYPARFVYGTMSISYEELSNWLGVENDWKRVGNFIASGGIPASPSDDADVALVDRVWVEATIDNVPYLFDPAWKTYIDIPGIDIGQAMAYDHDSFLNAATEGATITETYAQNLNIANLDAELASCTTNLVNTIHSKHPNASVEEIIGGRIIQQSQLSAYPTALPFPTSNEQYWDEVPDEYTTTIRIRHMGIDETYLTPDIAGKRLTVTYDTDSRPNLKLDGSVIATGDAVTTDDGHDLEIFIDHPYSALDGHYADDGASNDPAFCDPSVGCSPPYRVKRSTTCALITTFGGTSDNLLAYRQQQLNESLESGQAEGSEPVLGETINIMGLTWMKETRLAGSLLAELAQVRTTPHHRMGIVFQDEGYGFDMKLQTGSTFSRTDTDPAGYFGATNLINSGFEHGVLEQLMGSDRPAVSTIKLLQIANGTGEPVYWVTGATYDSIKGSLQDYSPNDLNRFQSAVDAGHALVLPRQGKLTLKEWSGQGYIDMLDSEGSKAAATIISGGYSGGSSASKGGVDSDWVNDATQDSTDTLQDFDTTQDVTSAEPVDMASGAYLYEHTDLVLGAHSPMPLRFHRSYTSNRRLEKSANNGFGYGWTHNYNIRLYETSDGNPGLGQRTPADMAPMIAACRASLDLFSTENEHPIQSWMVGSLTAYWAIDQLIDNAVTIHAGNKNLQFVKLPDGTYVAPPGITAMLSNSDGGGYMLQERFGDEMTFEKGPEEGYRIAYFQDIDDNRIDFAYADDKLIQVANNFGQVLLLNYTGDRIDSINDSMGRSVYYDYTEKDLTGAADPDGMVTHFGYDAGHRMTRLQNPLNITTAVNTYNTRNQVIHQSVPRQGGEQVTYNFYFSGYRNVEEDPEGYFLVSCFDRKGRWVGRQNKLGHRVDLTYDGQDHIVASTNSRGLKTTFTYDGNQNLIRLTDPLGQETTLDYDDQFRLTNIIDPLGHKVSRDYDGKHHLVAASLYPQDDQPVTRETAYQSNGLPAQVTDGRGISTVLAYDEYGHPASSQVADAPPVATAFDEAGRLVSLTDQENNTTGFQYNGRGLRTVETDPSGLSSRYSYNDDATLQARTDRNGDTTTYTSTVTGKVAGVAYPDGSFVEFVYDRNDLPVAMTDTLGTTTYTRDQAGRITAVTDAIGNTVSYIYDENGFTGLLTTMVYPDGNQVTYTYDEMNRLTGVTNWLGQTATCTYDEAGRLTSLVNFNGTTTTYSYDGANRLVGSVADVSQNDEIASFLYTLDGNGNRVGIEKQTPLMAPLPERNENAEYQANRLIGTDAALYSYDNQGQLAGKEQQDGSATDYSFNSAHRLTAINDDTTFQYDGTGNRLRAVRDGEATHYLYDIGGNLIGEADGDNNMIRYYVHGVGLLAAISATDEVYCYHFDATGSTVAITDESGGVVNAYAYSPFGMLLDESESFAQPFKYVGQYGVMAEPAGLYYMRARYYDPETGRFISEDPVGFDGGSVNLYAYVSNNPVNYLDPYGLESENSSSLDYLGDFLFSMISGAFQNYVYRFWPTTVAGPGLLDLENYFIKIATADDPQIAAAMGIYPMIMPPGPAADRMNSILFSVLTWGENSSGGNAAPQMPPDFGDFGQPGSEVNLPVFDETKR